MCATHPSSLDSPERSGAPAVESERRSEVSRKGYDGAPSRSHVPQETPSPPEDRRGPAGLTNRQHVAGVLQVRRIESLGEAPVRLSQEGVIRPLRSSPPRE